MAVPVWSVGQVLTASDVNTWLANDIAYKTSTTVRNTTTKTIDPDLQLAVAASAIYIVRCNLIYTSSVAMAFTWSFPTGATGGYTTSHNLTGTGAGTWGFVWSATVSTAALGGSVNGVLIQGMLQTSTTAGTFGVSWASDGSVSTLTMGVGSSLVLERAG